jgi:arylsulfatase A-like enzyme
LGKTTKQIKHEYLYWERDQSIGIRKGDMKAVIKYDNDVQTPSVKIYNLAADPFEKNDLTSSKPELKAELLNIAKTARVESELFPLFKKKSKKRD